MGRLRQVRILRRDGVIQRYRVSEGALLDYQYDRKLRAYVLIGAERRYLVIFSTHTTRDGKRTGQVVQFEVVVLSAREDAIAVATSKVEEAIKETPLTELWEGLTWLPGISETESRERSVVFRKLEGEPPYVTYSKRFPVN